MKQICKNCDALLEEAEDYCGRCGQEIAAKQLENEKVVVQNKRPRKILGIVYGAVLSGGVVLVLFLTGVFGGVIGSNNGIQNPVNSADSQAVMVKLTSEPAMHATKYAIEQSLQTQTLEHQIIGFWQLVARHLNGEVDNIVEEGCAMEFLANGTVVVYDGFVKSGSYEWHEKGDGRIQIDSTDDVFAMQVSFDKDSMFAFITHLGDDEEQAGDFIKVDKNEFIAMSNNLKLQNPREAQELGIEATVIFGVWCERNGQDIAMKFTQSGMMSVYSDGTERLGTYNYNHDSRSGEIFIKNATYSYRYYEDEDMLWIEEDDMWFLRF